ncbi:glycosyltransferase family 4 protein [Halobacillus locisalis]|uniref:Glycosyltransferase family 4 protein n=1 Tax=Halobacillus locisalis TaxID=220753 RepID=A0A838CU06_9BACI|nr:glycosyltransferase family 4 protein [Halobacillus locisalis]
MKKIVFFQPYIQKWRYDFLKRFINETESNYKVYSLYGKNESKKQKAGTYKNIQGINATSLLSVPIRINIKGQHYPVYWSPFLFMKLLRIRPDVIVTEGEINIFNNIAIGLYCKIFNKEYLWWSLGKVRNRNSNIINKLFKPIVNHYLQKSKFIIARNSLAKKYYLSNFNINHQKIIIAPNSLDEKAIDLEIAEYEEEANKLKNKYNGRKIILFSGAIIKGKRLDDLLYSINKIKSSINNVLCIIVGDGPEKSNLEKMVIKLGLEENVMFTGPVYKAVSKYFLIADLVVLPGMGGLVIHHAMVHSKPIVTRMADGVEEDLVFDGYNGYILRDYDNEKLVEKIMDVINQSEKINEMGNNSRNIVETRWNMNIMIKQIIKGIEK